MKLARDPERRQPVDHKGSLRTNVERAGRFVAALAVVGRSVPYAAGDGRYSIASGGDDRFVPCLAEEDDCRAHGSLI